MSMLPDFFGSVKLLSNAYNFLTTRIWYYRPGIQIAIPPPHFLKTWLHVIEMDERGLENIKGVKINLLWHNIGLTDRY